MTPRQESAPLLAAGLLTGTEPLRAEPLGEADTEDVLQFLSARPIHTVYLASLITDNGITSSLNRGSFFGCRDATGKLMGVALIGHATLIETESEDCIRAFAKLARDHSPSHLIRGEREKVETFWGHYTGGVRAPRLLCDELLLELKTMPPPREAVPGLRQATIEDLEMIVTVHAAMSFDESGIDPLTKDPQGFRERVARRINRGRIWVWVEDGHLLFKTDVISETAQTIYVEGVYVEPGLRTKGYGLRCLSQLAEILLKRTSSICLTVSAKAYGIQEFYRRAGYEVASRYDTLYLQPDSIS